MIDLTPLLQVVGRWLVFSTLEKRTYAARVSVGKIVWRRPVAWAP